VPGSEGQRGGLGCEPLSQLVIGAVADVKDGPHLLVGDGPVQQPRALVVPKALRIDVGEVCADGGYRPTQRLQ
jgi:hypothetical protein